MDSATERKYKKWSYFFKLFYRIVDCENGNYLHMPTNNPASQQPVKTMLIIDTLRDLWREKLKKEANQK